MKARAYKRRAKRASGLFKMCQEADQYETKVKRIKRSV